MNNNYRIPEGQRVYAIGDIHGFASTLAEMHALIEQDLNDRPIDEATIVYIGDYIDRGPDSKGVIDQLVERELVAPKIGHVFIMGNHEESMMQFLKDPNGQRQDWLHWGGVEALESYGVQVDRNKPFSKIAADLADQLFEALPTTHKEFLKNLQLHHQIGDYLFVHAGIRPGVKLEKQDSEDLMMIRDPFLSYQEDHGFRVVHGHTASKTKGVEIKPNRINLDSGHYDGGPLSCAVLEDTSVRLIEAWQED